MSILSQVYSIERDKERRTDSRPRAISDIVDCDSTEVGSWFGRHLLLVEFLANRTTPEIYPMSWTW